MRKEMAKTRNGCMACNLMRKHFLAQTLKQVTQLWLIAGSRTLSVPDFVPGLKRIDDEPVFDEPWEASAFALVVGLHEKGAFDWSEWADVLGATIKNNGEKTPYYESWLEALEKIISKKSFVESSEVEKREREWINALQATPHGSPIELKNGN